MDRKQKKGLRTVFIKLLSSSQAIRSRIYRHSGPIDGEEFKSPGSVFRRSGYVYLGTSKHGASLNTLGGHFPLDRPLEVDRWALPVTGN